MSLDPPKVMLDASFLAAIADASHPRHRECAAAYGDMVDRYERDELLLVAVSDHLREIDLGAEPTSLQRIGWFVHRPHLGPLAPVDPLYVGYQHRRAARDTKVDDPELAITLVMCERHKVRRVATLSDSLEQYGLQVVDLTAPPPTMASDDGHDDMPADDMLAGELAGDDGVDAAG